MQTLTEVAQVMGLNKVMKEPERYLTRQIKNGKIRARKIGRTWMMTPADVDYALEQFANALTESPRPEPTPPGMPSAASMRRRRAA